MKGRESEASGASAFSVSNMVCPAALRAGCPLGTAAVDLASGRDGLKVSLTECEIGIFLSLAPGHRVAVRNHDAGALWRGWVDVTFPDQGFVWVITDVGERKLFDIRVHTVWRAEQSGACGRFRQADGNGIGYLQ